jgi:hypothetical protein
VVRSFRQSVHTYRLPITNTTVGPLHSLVSRPAAAFRDGPADIVEGAFALTGFAVKAIGGIGGLYYIADGFVNTGGTKSDAGAAENRGAHCPADVGIENRQM